MKYPKSVPTASRALGVDLCDVLDFKNELEVLLEEEEEWALHRQSKDSMALGKGKVLTTLPRETAIKARTYKAAMLDVRTLSGH